MNKTGSASLRTSQTAYCNTRDQRACHEDPLQPNKCIVHPSSHVGPMSAPDSPFRPKPVHGVSLCMLHLVTIFTLHNDAFQIEMLIMLNVWARTAQSVWQPPAVWTVRRMNPRAPEGSESFKELVTMVITLSVPLKDREILNKLGLYELLEKNCFQHLFSTPKWQKADKNINRWCRNGVG